MNADPLQVRDRLQEFIALRNAARRQREWFQGESAAPVEDVREPSELIPPPWIRALQNFSELEQTVSSRMDRLHHQQHEFLAQKFLAAEDEEDLQHEAEALAADVQKLLKELERMVISGVRAQDAENSDEVRAAKNVQKHLTARLTKLLTSFKDGQQLFMEQLKKRDEKLKKFQRVGSAEVHEKLEREEKITAYMELGYSLADIHELLVEDARQQEISAEVQNILTSIVELQEMFKDLNAMVVDQGTMLDRIDYNITQSMDNVKAGTHELQKAREHQKKCNIM
jgi:syntaxin 16